MISGTFPKMITIKTGKAMDIDKAYVSEALEKADTYSRIYDESHRKVARQAFLEGIIFRGMLAIEENKGMKWDEEEFRILREAVIMTLEGYGKSH